MAGEVAQGLCCSAVDVSVPVLCKETGLSSLTPRSANVRIHARSLGLEVGHCYPAVDSYLIKKREPQLALVRVTARYTVSLFSCGLVKHAESQLIGEILLAGDVPDVMLVAESANPVNVSHVEVVERKVWRRVVHSNEARE